MVSLWKHYDKRCAGYEKSFPPAFPWNSENKQDVPRFVKGEDGYWYNPQAKESGKALLSCTGDLMCEPRMTNANRYGDSFFFHPLFQYVRNILKGSDFAVGNLETTLTDTTPYAGDYHVVYTKYHCNAPECYLDSVRYAGFDALVNANNHNCDSGLIGLSDTLRALDKHAFMHTGTFLPEDEERVLFVKINGIRVAILSYATYFNRLDPNLTQEGKDLWLNRYSKEKALREVAYARKKGAEFVMCYIHWGDDYDDVPNQEQYDILAELKETDVDYIVGSHTHCLQWHNVAVAENGKKIPMMYSMGNFVTNEKKELCKHTGILQLILRRENGKIAVREYFIPCYVFDQMGTSRYSVVPVDGLLNGGIGGEKLQQVREYVRNRIGPDLEELPTGAISLSELCSVMSTQLPAGMEDKPVTKLTVQVDAPGQNAVYFSMGNESDLDKRLMMRRSYTAIITKEPIENYPCILVEDVKKAYLAACSAVLARVPGAKRILVAGPEGKSLTCKIIDDVLENIGAVLTTLDRYRIDTAPWQNLHPYHAYCVQELRADNPMGVEVSVKANTPHICVITGMMDDLAQLVASLPAGALLLLNSKDAALVAEVTKMDTDHIRVDYYGDVTLDCPGLPFADMLPCAAAAYAVGREAGMEKETLRKAIAQYRVTDYTRNDLSVDGINLILNLSCKSVTSAKSAMTVWAQKPGRKLAILGDWDTVDQATWESMVQSALDMGAEKVICMGETAEAVCQVFGEGKVVAVADEMALEAEILPILKDGDALLLNGGRKMDFHLTLRRLFGLTDGYLNNSFFEATSCMGSASQKAYSLWR